MMEINSNDRRHTLLKGWDSVEVAALVYVLNTCDDEDDDSWNEDVWSEGAKFSLGVCCELAEITLDFDDPVTRVSLSAAQARELAERLNEWAAEAVKRSK